MKCRADAGGCLFAGFLIVVQDVDVPVRAGRELGCEGEADATGLELSTIFWWHGLQESGLTAAGDDGYLAICLHD